MNAIAIWWSASMPCRIAHELKGEIAAPVAINARLEITQARIETLLARAIHQGENGREA